MDNKKITVTNILVKMDSLRFDSKGYVDGDYKVNMSQNVALEECDGDSFVLKAKRNISFEPNTMYEMEIVLEISYTVSKDQTDEEFLNDVAKMKAHINEHLSEFYSFANGDSHFAAIIAQVTSWFGRLPLIVPVGINFMPEEPGKKK